MRAPGLDASAVTAADIAACRAILQAGSKSFHFASSLLPRRVRHPAAALYAFCRRADDAVDLDGGGDAVLAELAELLGRVYDGRPADDPMERALAATVRDYGIPRAVLDALIDGLAWDSEGRAYETLADLRAYAARVASTVGVASALLMGERSAAALARAADLGVAMQLTNIARDVGEDARNGRLYLPRAWMHDAGLCPDAWLAAPVFDRRLATVVERLLGHADELYQRSIEGIAQLPWDCRIGIHAARLIYAEIGAEVRNQGWNSVDSRAVVATRRKLQLLGTALTASLADRRGRPEPAASRPPLAETRFLIDAVRTHPVDLVNGRSMPDIAWWQVTKRLVWTIELFTRLAMEERLERGRR